MSKELGRANYVAYRQFGMLHIHAEGMKPNMQTKVLLEQLPIRIFPPQFALYFESPGIVSPMEMPFVVERVFPFYPTTVNTVTVVDAAGDHVLAIEQRPPVITPRLAPGSAYCVFKKVYADSYVIALCSDILPMIYRRVFGPASLKECEDYIASHASAAPAAISNIPPIHVHVASFKAWIDDMPGGPSRLIVTGEVDLPADLDATLVRAIPQGFNPAILLLHIEISGPVAQSSASPQTKVLRYEESPPKVAYTETTISGGIEPFTIPVEHVS